MLIRIQLSRYTYICIMYPTISRYIEVMREPAGFFRTLTPDCERDIYGEPRMMTGGNAVVFKVRIDGKPWALKCYTKPHVSVGTVYEAIPQLGSDLLCESRFLPQEIFVSGPGGGAWYDATLTEWAEGHTLEFAIRKALRDSGALHKTRCKAGRCMCSDAVGGTGHNTALASLAENFDRLAGELLNSPWAHGDLKPENIIVAPSGRMRLIDYDAMFVPQLAGRKADEQGTPLYQHPRRSIHHFDRHIDDYPVALISATLHALALDERLHITFGNSDSFLFTPAEILDGRSEGYRAALEMAAQRGEGLLYGLLSLLTSSVPWIDGLKDIVDAMNNCGQTPCAAILFANEGRWGYLAADGRTAIPPVFDIALEFKEETDTATVTLGGHEHSITRNGRVATQHLIKR